MISQPTLPRRARIVAALTWGLAITGLLAFTSDGHWASIFGLFWGYIISIDIEIYWLKGYRVGRALGEEKVIRDITAISTQAALMAARKPSATKEDWS